MNSQINFSAQPNGVVEILNDGKITAIGPGTVQIFTAPNLEPLEIQVSEDYQEVVSMSSFIYTHATLGSN